MCQRQSDDLPLLRIKKQLEELWHTTELLICILSKNCQVTKDSLNPVLRVERRSIPAPPDPILLSEHLEERLCEKIEQVISFTHSAVEKSKGCLITVDNKQKKIVDSTTVNSRKSDNTLAKDVDKKLALKTKSMERTRKSDGQSRANFLKSTYGSAFGKAKRHSADKSSKLNRICATSHQSKSVESSGLTSEKSPVNAPIFHDIDELFRSAITCSRNGGAVGGDPGPEKTKIEYIKASSNLEEALKKGLIEPHNELIHHVSSYQRSLDQLSRLTENCGNVHQSRFLKELQKRNEMSSASCEDSRRELQRCFSIIEKCPILTFDKDTSSNISTCKLPVMLFKYNDSQKWLAMETRRLESFFWNQHLQLLKSIESDMNNFISVENKTFLMKTLSSLLSIVPHKNSR
ncbi:hypothetical protein LSTR_LSTR000667 [Laodelphax striatellus]|uniref:Uncharacterized protein n=1 Tax=Laodelphax striatellus TaxID=195883 RepID=A0A482XFA5_LAOST|nr:hypothetical protein LSTR_LSTR000667 [Laodelphax striatellus]